LEQAFFYFLFESDSEIQPEIQILPNDEITLFIVKPNICKHFKTLNTFYNVTK